MNTFKNFFKGKGNVERAATTEGAEVSSDLAPRTRIEWRWGLGDPVFEDHDPQVDIIAIHGLNGDRVETWTEGGVFWLRDLLPTTLSERGIRARIWSYGYNADSHSGGAVSVEDLWGHGDTFLAQVVARRQISNTERRPILFIAHSLGGLILKSALVRSSNSTPTHFKRNKALALSTHGIIFCGVPHQGGKGVAEAKILLNVSSIFTNTTTNIVRVLEPGNEVLRNHRESFTFISGDFYTVALFETEETPVKVGTKLIVPRDSAVIPGSSGTKYWAPIGLNGKNHISLVKFSSAQDPGYDVLSIQLLLMLAEPFRDVNDKWGKWDRDLKEKDYIGSRLQPKFPHAPSPRFCGRNDELSQIEAFLKQNAGNTQNVVAIYGAGGMGKTEVVLQYTYQHQKDYTSVIWINATSKTTAETALIGAMQDLIFIETKNAPGGNPDYVKIATDLDIVGLIGPNGLLNIPEEDSEAVRRVVDGVKGWLARYVNGTFLLVFDNHDDMSFPLREFFPTCTRGSIIITSRRPEVKSYATLSHFHELEGLDQESAVKLLLSISGRDQGDQQVRAGAQSVVETLHYLPLAIDQAAAFISLRPQMTFDAYLARYNRKAKELLGKNEHPWPEYKLTCMTTWEISREAIREKSKPAAVLLQVCSFFNNADIWGEFLRRSLCHDGTKLSGDEIDDLIAMLYSYSLAKPKLAADTFSIHGVVHTWARERLEPDDKIFTMVAAARMMRDATIFVHGQSASRATSEYVFERRLLPHMEFFMKVNKAIFGVAAMKKALPLTIAPDPDFRAKVLSSLDSALSTVSLVDPDDPEEEVKPSPLVSQRYFRDLNSKDPDNIVDQAELASSSIIILANALGRQGRHRASARLEISLTYLYLCLSDQEDTSNVVAHMTNLASQFRDMGHYDGSELLYRFALREWPRACAETARQLPRIKDGLATTLSRMGKYPEAAQLQSETLSLQAKDTADVNLDNADMISNRAINLQRQEKYADAERLHRLVLACRENKLGPDHADTCISLNSLAVTLEKQNKLTEAELMHRRALGGRQAIFPNGHLSILRSMSNLAVTLKKQGKLTNAAELFSECIEGYVRWHGEEHEETLRTRKNLAIIWAKQKDFTKAAAAMGTCAQQLASKLGIERPETLNAISDWAYVLIDIGRLKGASNLFWYILQVRLRVLVVDRALRRAFEGLDTVRKRYVALGRMDKVKWLDEMVPKQEALMMARHRADTQHGPRIESSVS